MTIPGRSRDVEMQSHFDNELFEFLVELQANNNREWFAEHKVLTPPDSDPRQRSFGDAH